MKKPATRKRKSVREPHRVDQLHRIRKLEAKIASLEEALRNEDQLNRIQQRLHLLVGLAEILADKLRHAIRDLAPPSQENYQQTERTP